MKKQKAFPLNCNSCGTPVKFVETKLEENSRGYKYDSAYDDAVKYLRKIRDDYYATPDQGRKLAHEALKYLSEV